MVINFGKVKFIKMCLVDVDKQPPCTINPGYSRSITPCNTFTNTILDIVAKRSMMDGCHTARQLPDTEAWTYKYNTLWWYTVFILNPLVYIPRQHSRPSPSPHLGKSSNVQPSSLKKFLLSSEMAVIFVDVQIAKKHEHLIICIF